MSERQQLVEAANKHFPGDATPRHLQPSSHSAARCPILCAWRWPVRIPAKEAVLNALCTSDTADMSDLEGPTDLAYLCVMPASLGYAIQKIEPPPGITEPTIEDVATLLDINLAAKESADRNAL